jgi:hypothetical protein
MRDEVKSETEVERERCLAVLRDVAALYTPQDTYVGSMQNPPALALREAARRIGAGVAADGARVAG